MNKKIQYFYFANESLLMQNVYFKNERLTKVKVEEIEEKILS